MALIWIFYIAIITTLVGFLVQVAYNILFHPLRKYPGPLSHRISRLPWASKLSRGTLVYDVFQMHTKYGPVVRIAPDELSFADPAAWRDIYGHRAGAAAGLDEMAKHVPFYKLSAEMPSSIISAGREEHSFLRRQLANGFSERSMRQQEPLINRHVDLLLQRLREKSYATKLPNRREPIDLTSWYNWTTFDIIGDLAFGDSFGCLESSDYHPWVKLIFGSIREGALLQSLRYLGFNLLLIWLMRIARKYGDQHEQLIKEKIQQRIKAGVERPDLIEGLLQKQATKSLDIEHIHTNAGILIIAGSETTATLLCGVTYLLLTHPKALERLTLEVRSSFQSEEEITLTSVNKLSYMLACLNEALRCYPPLAGGLPRVVPRDGSFVGGYFVPEETIVSIHQYTVYHSEDLWTDPFGFWPERFMGDSRFANDAFDAFQPFSFGPRNCIGRNLAYAEMRLILARIIFTFDMQIAEQSRNWLDNQKNFNFWEKPPLQVHLAAVRD